MNGIPNYVCLVEAVRYLVVEADEGRDVGPSYFEAEPTP